MCVLTALVGVNYMVICRLYPDGGGVYASVRHRSEVISIVGAFAGGISIAKLGLFRTMVIGFGAAVAAFGGSGVEPSSPRTAPQPVP